MSGRGYQISLLSVEKSNNFEKRADLIEDITRQNKISWHYITYTKKPPVVSTLYDLRRLIQKVKKLHQAQSFDFFHCRSYISALVGLYFKKNHRVPFIFDMRGFWADERVDGGLWNLKNPVFHRVYRYFKKKEKEFLKEAAYTISLTHKAKEEMESWAVPGMSPVQVIPCCVDTDLFREGKVLEVPFEDAPRIAYLGSIGTWYMLEEMLLFFKQLQGFYPKAHFNFITTEAPEKILAPAQKIGLKPASFTISRAERKEVPQRLAENHLSIFFIKPLFSKMASSATKMGEILAMGLPVIANRQVGDHEYLFEKYACGLMVDLKDNPRSNAQAFDKLIPTIPALLKVPASERRQVALEYFSLAEGVAHYQKVYEAI
ncbi:MAG: glycosyltransferase [Bacteroidota bacterium]